MQGETASLQGTFEMKLQYKEYPHTGIAALLVNYYNHKLSDPLWTLRSLQYHQYGHCHGDEMD